MESVKKVFRSSDLNIASRQQNLQQITCKGSKTPDLLRSLREEQTSERMYEATQNTPSSSSLRIMNKLCAILYLVLQNATVQKFI